MIKIKPPFIVATIIFVLMPILSTSQNIILVTEDPFADALVGSPASVFSSSPILVTPNNFLDWRLIYALQQVKPEKLFIIGGPVAVSEKIEEELKKYVSVERIWGPTRFETAQKVALKFWTRGSETVVMSFGDSYADSLVASSLASKLGVPLIYVRPLRSVELDPHKISRRYKDGTVTLYDVTTGRELGKFSRDQVSERKNKIIVYSSRPLDHETRKTLLKLGVKRVILVGGPENAMEDAETDLIKLGMRVERYPPKSPFETSEMLIRDYMSKKDMRIMVVDIDDKPLTGTALSGELGMMVLLRENKLGSEDYKFLRDLNTRKICLFGVDKDAANLLKWYGYKVANIVGKDPIETSITTMSNQILLYESLSNLLMGSSNDVIKEYQELSKKINEIDRKIVSKRKELVKLEETFENRGIDFTEYLENKNTIGDEIEILEASKKKLEEKRKEILVNIENKMLNKLFREKIIDNALYDLNKRGFLIFDVVISKDDIKGLLEANESFYLKNLMEREVSSG
ncbi:MAG: cell wall-binding repeat-containing protein [Candidatus Hydrothermarchaeota archaeon]